MRHIVFVGLGNFGFHCARNLEGRAEVTAIDISREAVQRIGPFVSRAVMGDATQKPVLEELGIQNADAAVVSLGNRMDASILATLHLKSLGINEIYVKSLSEEHAQVCELVGATRVIHPEREVAENLAVSILETTVVDYLKLHENFGIIEIVAPQSFWGKNLIELDLRRRYNVNIMAIFGSAGKKIINPHPETVISEDDSVIVLGETEAIMNFQDSLA